MKKKMCVLGVAALVAVMLALPGVSHSAMWVGAEIGGNFPLNTDLKIDAPGPFTGTLEGVHIQPSLIGGAIIGYDFVNSGFGGRAWPGWMQYFSFATDVTYNKINIRGGQTVGVNINGVNLGNAVLPNNLYLKGYEVAWTFLFMAHYGFLRDSEVPSGRINPYIGVGPAILWTGYEGAGGNNGAHSMNIALVVEPGIRWMALSNVSIDTAMRYRYAAPAWDFGNNVTITANPLHQIAFLLRANYHF
jgi:hypothetical protein